MGKIVSIVDRRKVSKINSIVWWREKPTITSIVDFITTIRG
jgi:hypothetical protein